MNRPFPQESELETKSARLSQLNIELDNDGGAEVPSQDGNEGPAKEETTPPVPQGDKTSIRQATRKFNPLAPVELDMSSVVELVKLLRSISSNVNQIARRSFFICKTASL